MNQMNEINPEHPVTKSLHDHWHKIVALLLMRFTGGAEVVITVEDIKKFGDGRCVAIEEKKDGLHVWLVDEAEARRLAREEGAIDA